MNLESWCPANCVSAHYLADTKTMLKCGSPGSIKIQNGTIKSDKQIKELIESIQMDPSVVIEKQSTGSIILTCDKFRIVYNEPPLVKTSEITLIQHTFDGKLSDYKIDKKLLDKFANRNGVLIAGAPGQGKSTFVATVLNFLNDKNIIKTVESPRDLHVDGGISQISNDIEKDSIRDQLLLSRPDIVCIDEIRHPKDMKLFADLRLCGIGCFGVIHATKPIDAIARMLPHLDLGSIPHIIDTVIFIEGGKIKTTFTLCLEVKVPSGLQGKELTRPVIVVQENNNVIYELYNFSDQLVIKQPEDQEEDKLSHVWNLLGNCPKHSVNGKNIVIDDAKFSCNEQTIQAIESLSGFKIQLKNTQPKKQIPFEPIVSQHSIGLRIDSDQTCSVFIDDEYLLCGKASKKGTINIKPESAQGKMISQALLSGRKVTVLEHLSS